MQRAIKIAPSLLAADFSKMGEEVKRLENCGADMFHFDVMDGTFVSPITFGGQMVQSLRGLSSLVFDCHLMIEHPKTQIEFFKKSGADIITVHFEACAKISDSYLRECLQFIKNSGIKCGVAINPDCPPESIFPVMDMCDMVLVMSVFPGYGGQAFIESSIDSIKKVREYALKIGKGDMDIQVDGGINLQNVKKVIEAGANVIVAGSTIFKAQDMAKTITELRQ